MRLGVLGTGLLLGLTGCASAPPVGRAPVAVVSPQANCMGLSGRYTDLGTWVTPPSASGPAVRDLAMVRQLSYWLKSMTGSLPLPPRDPVATLDVTVTGLTLHQGDGTARARWRGSDGWPGELKCDQGRVVWTHRWIASGGSGPLELIPGDVGLETLVLTRAADGSLLGTRIRQSHRLVGGYARREEWVRWAPASP